MLGGAVLETAIALSFLFFLTALLCAGIVEAIANLFKKRAKYLLRGLRDLLDDPKPSDTKRLTPNAVRVAEGELNKKALNAAPSTPTRASAAPSEPAAVQSTFLAKGTDRAVALMGHPLINPLKQSEPQSPQRKTRNPSYIPGNVVAVALLDLIVPNAAGDTTMDKIREQINVIHEDFPLKGALLSLANSAGDSVDGFRKSLEQWYDTQMDRISGAYKRWAKRWVIVFALAVAIALQVDTLAAAKSLYSDGPLRATVVAAATNETLCAQDADLKETRACIDKELKALDAEGLPIGWSKANLPDHFWEWFWKVVGWGITAGSAALGAPFWFDSLTRLGSLRNTGNKPTSSTS